MAITVQSDLKVYDPRIQVGYREAIDRVIQIFNGASGNCIRLTSESRVGEYDYKAFWSRLNGIVTRRDMTSTAAVASIKPVQTETTGVKLSRKIGPVDVARGAMIRAGLDVPGEDDAAMVALGEWVAEAALTERVDTAIAAIGAALTGQSAITNDISGGSGAAAKVSAGDLANTLAKRGDLFNKVGLWVMHSKPYFDLVGQQIAGNVTGVASVVMNGGSPATLGRPVLVTDSPSLIVTGTPNKYRTLGLIPDSLVVTDSESEYIVNQLVTGNEQIVHRMQGEYAYSLDMLGFTWDVANGGVNPTSATVSTSSNWDPVFASLKNVGGVALVSQ